MSVESCYSFFSWPPLHNKCISPKKSSNRSSSNSYSYFLQADSNRLPVQFLLQCRQRGPSSLSLSSSFHLALAFSKWALLSDRTTFIHVLQPSSKPSMSATRGALIARQNTIMAAAPHVHSLAGWRQTQSNMWLEKADSSFIPCFSCHKKNTVKVQSTCPIAPYL